MNTTLKYERFGSHSGNAENSSFLGCDTMSLAGRFRNALFWLTTWRVVVISYRRFETYHPLFMEKGSIKA